MQSLRDVYSGYKTKEAKALNTFFGHSKWKNWGANVTIRAMESKLRKERPCEETLNRVHSLLVQSCLGRHELTPYYENASSLAKNGHENFLKAMERIRDTILKQPSPPLPMISNAALVGPKISDIDDEMILCSLGRIRSQLDAVVKMHRKACEGSISLGAVAMGSDHQYGEIFSLLKSVHLMADESNIQISMIKARLKTLENEFTSPASRVLDQILGSNDVRGFDDSTKDFVATVKSFIFSDLPWDEDLYIVRTMLNKEVVSTLEAKEDSVAHHFHRFGCILAVHILFKLERIWLPERLENIKKATFSHLERLHAQVSEAQIPGQGKKILDHIDEECRFLHLANDISSIAAIHVATIRIQSAVGEYFLSLPLVPTIAHLYCGAVLRKIFNSDETFEQLCAFYENALFWNGRPQSLNSLKESLHNWVRAAYRSKSNRTPKALWQQLGSAKIKASRFRELYEDQHNFFINGKGVWQRFVSKYSTVHDIVEALDREVATCLIFDPCLLAEIGASTFYSIQKPQDPNTEMASAIQRHTEIAESIMNRQQNDEDVVKFLQSFVDRWNKLEDTVVFGVRSL